MSVWLRIEGNINGQYSPRLVFSPDEADRLSGADAQQVIRSASQDSAYQSYLWKPVRVEGPDRYIVEGTEKR